jgi:hypothetical protein
MFDLVRWAAELTELRSRFGATHVVVPPQSIAYDQVRSRWPVVYDTGGNTQWIVADVPEASS